MRTHLHGDWSVVLIPEIRGLVPTPLGEMFPVGEETGRGHPDVRVDGGYSSVGAFDEEFRVEETFDAEDDPVGTSETYRDAKCLSQQR